MAECLQEVYTQKARELEAEGKLRDAEKLYCSIKAYDSAIDLYKQHSMWDHVVRLVAQHRKVCCALSTYMCMLLRSTVIVLFNAGFIVFDISLSFNSLCRKKFDKLLSFPCYANCFQPLLTQRTDHTCFLPLAYAPFAFCLNSAMHGKVCMAGAQCQPAWSATSLQKPLRLASSTSPCPMPSDLFFIFSCRASWQRPMWRLRSSCRVSHPSRRQRGILWRAATGRALCRCTGLLACGRAPSD